MERNIFLLALLAAVCGDAFAASSSTNSAAANRILLIDPSSMPVAAGKATLIIGALQRTNGIYAGDYKLKVFPYFLKSEKGRLAILVPDTSLAEVSQGKIVAIIGTATTSGKGGKSRTIAATATPVDRNHGRLKICFKAGDKQMTFEPAYHFAGKATAAVPSQTTETSFAASLPRHLSLSHPEASEAAINL